MKKLVEGEIIWSPSQERIKESILWDYLLWLKKEKGIEVKNYEDMWRWSVNELEAFWESVWEFTGVIANTKYQQVLGNDSMPGAEWFKGANLNFTENAFAQSMDTKTALYFRSEFIPTKKISWATLKMEVASVARNLKELGVKSGDRVAAYLPNIPETIVAFLATASIGAIWSVCSPDFGSRSVIDRFKQIEPVVLLAVDGYSYNGKKFDKRADVQTIQNSLPTLQHTVFVPYIQEEVPKGHIPWQSLLTYDEQLTFEPLPFDHPLWIVYSSGTTGLPKPIVHSHGGIIVELKKVMMIQHDCSPDDIVYWFTSTGWIMWNLLIGGLLTGSSIVLYDGSPSFPNMDVLWELAEEIGITFFGTSAPFLLNSMKMDIRPNEKYDLSKLKSVFSTGAPLNGDGYKWVYEHVKSDVWLVSTSGGTDICSGFVGGVPVEPVRIGEIQGRSLGVAAEAFDEEGNPLTGEVGELVITKPMPSMPLYFWNDKDNERYRDSYFGEHPDVWTHGDWIKINENGSCVIYGRSDSTINRSGVRMGTSDVYRVIGTLDEAIDSLVIDLEVIGKSASLILFIVLKEGFILNEELKSKIKNQIREHLSPRFAPDEIYEVEDIPKTLNGKKLEVPIRKLLLGFDADKVINPDSMGNPESLPFFLELAKKFNESRTTKIF
ncbi:acetoacetate--CoA ligase [Sporosarcina ureilytica]|uniref:acetoacetate--CoA ligase n=1 Tax=Sporosarcina ureilytica TaxID=298596 RepID=UPI00094D0044|nr:acetoacetate--CoA ligase [Sporosarcina ureilytica]